jgi:hypothetical protein
MGESLQQRQTRDIYAKPGRAWPLTSAQGFAAMLEQ